MAKVSYIFDESKHELSTEEIQSGSICPSDENDLTKAVHCLELTAVFIIWTCHPSLNVLPWIESRETCRTVPKSALGLLKESIGHVSL